MILAIVGYYVGRNYASIGTTLGTGIGIAAGAIISGVIWYSSSEEHTAFAF